MLIVASGADQSDGLSVLDGNAKSVCLLKTDCTIRVMCM